MNAPTRLFFAAFVLAACDAVPASPTFDAGPDALTDVAPDRVPLEPLDADPREAGGLCSFNRDCVASERCECSEPRGCRCASGARGSGRSGVDACTSGNDCASALCVEGSGGAMVCSDACTEASECPASLPRCLQVPFVGRFCARDPAALDGGSADAGGQSPLLARFGARTGAFERAQHGAEGADNLYIEAHSGGDPACPTMGSPTPRRTLVLSGVRASVSAVQTEASGVRASLLDFSGDLVSVPLLRATSVRLTPRSVNRGVSVSFDVIATFPGGSIEGTFTAPHCASLNGR